jgi:hypothetical protein
MTMATSIWEKLSRSETPGQVGTVSQYGAFNARFLDPEDVARLFVPTPDLAALVKMQHCLLMGPRGCGKTTLLKMLTRRAQTVWQTERISAEPDLARYGEPDFEAIYIPSDIRWSYELRTLAEDFFSDPSLLERVQRCMISFSCLAEACNVFESLLGNYGQAQEKFLRALIKHFGISDTVPSFRELRLKCMSVNQDVRNCIVRRDPARLSRLVDGMASPVVGHAFDTLERACSVFDEYVPASIRPKKWAFCFDELEIGPDWLKRELLSALRSVRQNFLLKLTWSPVLPLDASQKQEFRHDYTIIKLWHSHADSARPFCKEFATRFVRAVLRNQKMTPRQLLGSSDFARDDESGDAYAQNSSIWQELVELAKWDKSFEDYLVSHEIDPANPVPHTIEERDRVLRKVKPIALIRNAYLRPIGGRSRKKHLLYSGEEAVYAMSEGNPRQLAGLLSDILDRRPVRRSEVDDFVDRRIQADVLYEVSGRSLTGIKTYPVPVKEDDRPSLGGIVDLFGKFLNYELVGKTFSADPIGSFIVDDKVDKRIVREIEIGLLIGAFVSVGKDPPASVTGARIRLSYMLSPHYRLLFRNYRDIQLSTAFKMMRSRPIVSPARQEMLPYDSDADT